MLATGAPDAVLPLCGAAAAAGGEVERMAREGLRVLAVAAGPLPRGTSPSAAVDELEGELRLLGLAALQDPPRDGVTGAVRSCRAANIHLTMITGDHPGTARAIAEQVGLALPVSPPTTGRRALREPDGRPCREAVIPPSLSP